MNEAFTSELLEPDSLLDRLRKRGYTIDAPDSAQ